MIWRAKNVFLTISSEGTKLSISKPPLSSPKKQPITTDNTPTHLTSKKLSSDPTAAPRTFIKKGSISASRQAEIKNFESANSRNKVNDEFDAENKNAILEMLAGL